MEIKLPDKGFTHAERAWLAELLKEIQRVTAISGKNTFIDNTPQGQVINAIPPPTTP